MSEYELTRLDLQTVFESFKRWDREGRKPYWQSAPYTMPNDQKQYFYDTYHDSITEDGPDTYRFRIQTSDSPEGDTWVSGRFRANGLGTVEEILEQRSEFC